MNRFGYRLLRNDPRTARIVSDLVGDPENRFSYGTTQMFQNCEADNSKRRRRRDTGNSEGKATLTTYVQLIEPIGRYNCANRSLR